MLSFDRSSDVTPTDEAVCGVLSALAAVVELVVATCSRPDEPLFEPCTGAVDAVVLLGGSGVRSWPRSARWHRRWAAGATRCGWPCAAPAVTVSLRTSPRARSTCRSSRWCRTTPRWRRTLLHGTPPGSSARSVVAGAADAILLQLLVAHRVAS